MCHGIYLIVVGAVGKGGALLDEIVHRRSVKRMRQADVAGASPHAD